MILTNKRYNALIEGLRKIYSPDEENPDIYERKAKAYLDDIKRVERNSFLGIPYIPLKRKKVREMERFIRGVRTATFIIPLTSLLSTRE